MQTRRFERLRMLAVFEDAPSRPWLVRVMPLRFQRQNGEVHRVRQIRRIYPDQKGKRRYIHFVVKTRERRYFDLVYDPQLNIWKLVLELREEEVFPMLPMKPT